MIELAREKALERKVANVEFIVGNARSLPFEDNSFDCVTVGFGIRNIPDVNRALARWRESSGRAAKWSAWKSAG